MKSKNIVIVIIVLIVLGAVVFHLSKPQSETKNKIRYGITPYQDSALPVVADTLGWYKEAGLDVELVPVTWGNVVTALAGNAIDVTIYNFNSFQPPYENASKGSLKPVFYCPLYLFKGQAIMVRSDSGMQVFREQADESIEARNNRIAEVSKQLKSKRIAVTEGTELEQIVLAALQKAGLSKNDATLIHASPEDSLAAFLAGNVDAFAAGLTERVEARRHGATELLVTADVMLPVIDGIVTTDKFARENTEMMDKLIRIWFRTIRFMEEDIEKNSIYIRSYLEKAASTRYSPDEYTIAWTFNTFPHDANEADKLFNDPSSPAYWKTSWDATNEYLLEERKVKGVVPYEAYWGESVLRKLSD